MSRVVRMLGSVMLAAIVIAAGFASGLVIGVVAEEPELVLGHLRGRSEEVPWRVAERAPAADRAASLEAKSPIASAAPEPDEGAGRADLPAVSARPAGPGERLGERTELGARSEPGATTDSQGFVVQVGAFAASEAAEEIAADLLGKGYSVFVAEPTGGDGRWRVRVGPVAGRVAADALAAGLAGAEGLPTWVRPVDES